jgi:hypothetical protein
VRAHALKEIVQVSYTSSLNSTGIMFSRQYLASGGLTAVNIHSLRQSSLMNLAGMPGL